MDPKWTSGNELKYLKQVLDNAKEVRDNAFTDRLESAFKNKYNVKYAIALNSGASALPDLSEHVNGSLISIDGGRAIY